MEIKFIVKDFKNQIILKNNLIYNKIINKNNPFFNYLRKSF